MDEVTLRFEMCAILAEGALFVDDFVVFVDEELVFEFLEDLSIAVSGVDKLDEFLSIDSDDFREFS